MSMPSGARLGPYEIVAAIGAGGMGEIYKARDTRLDRVVAVKILSETLASDPQFRERFQREARAISQLTHPHICRLYDVGESAGTAFLVMEYLEGETLEQRLKRGALPLDQALTIAIEIADALSVAHRHGIVHRDVKPGNVMLVKGGAKLLDFGLAKTGAAGTTVTGLSTLPTAPANLTAQGTILGTFQYMAPEQLEAHDADASSDIWALGAVLYEMATGVPPFTGDTTAAIIGAILRDTPPAVSTRQPLAPLDLDRVIEHCLMKDRDERWQSIGDVRRTLQLIAARQTADLKPRARLAGAWWERGAWIGTTVVLLIALAVGVRQLKRVVPPTEIVRLSVNLPESTIFTPQMDATVAIPQFALSPDGRAVTYVGGRPSLKPTLWLRQLGDLESRPIAGTEDAEDPFWSPDGRWIGFFDAQGTMKRVAIAGDAVQTIASNISDPRGASWGPDDTILFGTGYSEIYRVPAAGGTPQPVTRLDASKEEGSHRWPQFLPDGKRFLFTARSGLSDHRNVYVGALDEESRHHILRLDSDAHYVMPGYLLFLDGDVLLGQPFDSDRLMLSGKPTPIQTHVGRSSRGNAAFSASSSGTIAYAGATLRTGHLTWFDRTGTALGTVGPDGEHDYADFRLSADDQRLAASLVDPKLSVPDIWLFDLVRGGSTRLTFGPALNAAPVWSPHGDRIAFRTNRKGLLELYQKSAVAGGADEPLVPEDVARKAGVGQSTLLPTDWSADGGRLAITAGRPSDIWLLTIADPTSPVRVVQSEGDQMHANFSPDGSLIAYTSNESGRFDVYAQSLQPPARKWTISVNGGYEPRWRADGRELYYLADDQTLMAVSVSAAGVPLGVPFGVPRALFVAQVHAGVSSLRTHYASSRDGGRFLIHRRSDVPPTSITVVLNAMMALQR